MPDRCPTCDRPMEEMMEEVMENDFDRKNIFHSVFGPRRSLRETISQTIAIFGGIAVGVVIGRGSAESTRTLIYGCIGFAIFSILIQFVSHKWLRRRET